MLLTAFLVGVVVLAISLRLQRIITGPIAKLGKSMEQIRTSKDYAIRVKEGRNDEVGKLTHIFNGMIEEIEVTNKSLQAEVEDRTEELQRRIVAETEAGLAKEEAERANHAKSDFLSKMSHELRTPMNAVIGFAQLLDLSDLDEKQHASVKHVLDGGRHLLGLINEVLDIAKIDSGHISVSCEPVLLLAAIQEVRVLAGPMAAKKDIHIEISAGIDSDLYIRADRQRLNQVLLNLLSNAIKYNKQFGKVEVWTTQPSSDRLRIHIRDTGHGIPESMRSRMFTPFDRLGAEGSATEGTGLGLALSKALTQAMGGSLELEASHDGEGACFAIEVPVADAPAGLVVVEGGKDSRVGALDVSEKCVLYVEDNLANLRLVEQILQFRNGIRLIPAMQGSMALELAREHKPDLILLDLHLPDKNGSDVLRELKADPELCNIPVVVVTADAMSDRPHQMIALGAHQFLSKPFDIGEFLRVIDEYLFASNAGLIAAIV